MLYLGDKNHEGMEEIIEKGNTGKCYIWEIRITREGAYDVEEMEVFTEIVESGRGKAFEFIQPQIDHSEK